jgi:choline-sulfatase
MSEKPNILVLMADQLTPGALPAYGNKVARTPHLDRLADAGVVFDSAYCNSPLCAPSRYVFLSGRLPSATGGFDNAAEFPSQCPTFVHYLRHAGYRTILAGKMHFCGPDQLHGFEERLTTDIYPADYAWTPDWTRFDERPDWYHNMDSVTQAGPCVRTNQMDFDEEVCFAARRTLFDIVRGNDDRPFCMVVSMTHPHDPFAIPESYWNRYREDEIDMPRVRIPVDQLDPHSRRLRHVCGLDLQEPTEAQIRTARHAYYGAVSYFDEQAGAILDVLQQTGLAESTIVVVLADHGEMLGERGLWYKMNFFEPACRVPLIVHAPGSFAPRRVREPVSLADILPTFAELAGGGRVPDYAAPIDGRSLLPHLTGAAARGEVVGEYLAEGAIAPIVMIRRGPHKFIHSPADPDQLFDIAADPDELSNLAHDPAFADLTAIFRQEVESRWDLSSLHAEVLASQKRRRFVADTLRLGRVTAWDHQPMRDASQLYIRNHMKLDDMEAMARFPRVEQTSGQ